MISKIVIFNLCLFGQSDKLLQIQTSIAQAGIPGLFWSFLQVCNASFLPCFGDKSTRLINPLSDSTMFVKMQYIIYASEIRLAVFTCIQMPMSVLEC